MERKLRANKICWGYYVTSEVASLGEAGKDRKAGMCIDK